MRGERVKVSGSRALVGEREIRAGAKRGKSELHSKGRQIPRREGGQARRVSLVFSLNNTDDGSLMYFTGLQL